MEPTLIEKLRAQLRPLYGSEADPLAHDLLARIRQCRTARGEVAPRTWSQRDVVLITYADQVRSKGQPPLATLRQFLTEQQLQDAFNTVHLLPFFPYSSDDGFSVIDYRQVDPAVGTWSDIEALRREFRLMFDLVLNHASQASEWFQAYLQGTPPYDQFFIEADPMLDYRQVVRPRSLPLLTRVTTRRGERHVWTTFSADQVDLNYRCPRVLAEMVDILLMYVERGASIIRLDAIAYLWKEVGTSCIHLPQTHAIVKLLRLVLEAAAPDVWLLTETNVPHHENISYFGQGDEAHLVYQFSLPPLLLDAFVQQDAGPLQRWLAQLEPAPASATFLNFTASHDGIGVRPLQGLVPPERIAALVEHIQQRGGRVSTKRDSDGQDSPYELNITYFDALRASPDEVTPSDIQRFLSSQALMLALQGIPAVYFHALVGSPNDVAAVEATGQPRRINRHKYERSELNRVLADPQSVQGRVLRAYRTLLRTRAEQPAFQPDAAQRVLYDLPTSVTGWVRDDVASGQRILVLANVSGQRQQVPLPADAGSGYRYDLISGSPHESGSLVTLEPYQTKWIATTAPSQEK